MQGTIPGVEEGRIFKDRKALHAANVHRGLMKGIAPGGYSIVLSGGYVDDEDLGDTIIYTGEGGRDANTGRQIADQQLTGGNLNLANNFREGIPIRVNRGYQADSDYAPPKGYKYGGLYRIEACWHERGRDGFVVWRYRLVKITASDVLSSQASGAQPPYGQTQPKRTSIYTTRIIRNSETGNSIKALYNHTCQISGTRLQTPTGPYAESCHIKPLGRPHSGPDTVNNILCLSPNIHVLFDFGAIAISDDLRILGMDSQFTVRPEHHLSEESIVYHREHIFKAI
ncbi:MAG: HNH endonuclease [Deltaproteobacteria bacterium]|nr:HNH endonuclease [Deltaproteobacteria bacterium]